MLNDDLAFSLAVFGLFLFAITWSTHLFAHIYCRKKFSKKDKVKKPDSKNYPGVSILKPIKGVDDKLLENLEPLFNQEYPTYEILFCFHDPNDPAILFVRHMMSEYPQVDVRLFYDGEELGPNVKISNLLQCYEYVKYDLIFISDPLSKAEKDTLLNLVNELDDKVGLIHQIPFVCDGFGFSNALEKVDYGSAVFRKFLFVNSVIVRLKGQRCMSGYSYLLRKHLLDKIGGLRAFAFYLDEDSFIARAFIDEKWTVRMSNQIEMLNQQVHQSREWRQRAIRRSQIRLRTVPSHWVEPIFECFFIGIFTSLSIVYYLQWFCFLFFFIHVVCWCLSDYMLMSFIQNGPMPFSKFEYVISWIYREIMFYVIFVASFSSKVKIKGDLWRIKCGGELAFVEMHKLREIPSPVKLSMLKRLNANNLPLPCPSTNKKSSNLRSNSITKLNNHRKTSHKRRKSF